MRRALLLVLLVAVGSRPARAQNVGVKITTAVNRFQSVVADTFGRSLPLPSASAGVSYSFDPVTGNFQRDPTTFGQLYVDRAEPIGARRLNLAFAYQYVRLDSIEGQPADDLRDPTPSPIPGKAAAFVFPHLRAEAAVHQFLFALTYGISENLEATIAVPLAYSNNRVSAEFRAVALFTDGTLRGFSSNIDEPQQTFGVGDVLLRAKYRVLDTGPLDAAAGLLLRFPSGSQEDLQGIGFFEVTPSALASTRVFTPAPWARLQGHMNAGVGFDTEDVSSSQVRWGLGLDWGLSERFTAAVSVLGRHQLARIAPPGAFDFPRCQSDLVTCATDASVRHGTSPLFGLSGDRPDYYDVSVGGRGALWRDTVFAFVDVLIPLNDGAVRTAPIPLVGLEATF